MNDTSESSTNTPPESATDTSTGADGWSLAGRFRRFGAFLIEYFIIHSAWTILNNVVTTPWPPILDAGIPALLAVLYFAVLEGWGERQASFGKSVLGLEIRRIAHAPDERTWRCPPGSVLFRAVIVVVLVDVDLAKLLPAIADNQAVASVALGLLLYNVWLGLGPEPRVMLQDVATRTRVVMPSAVVLKFRPDRVSLSHAGIAIALAFGLVTAGARFEARISGEQTTEEQRESRAASIAAFAELENMIASEVGIRARVGDVKAGHIIHIRQNLAKDSAQVYALRVWVPWSSWNDQALEKIVKVVVTNLRVSIGVYEKGFLVLETGGAYSVSHYIELNMPTAPAECNDKPAPKEPQS